MTGTDVSISSRKQQYSFRTPSEVEFKRERLTEAKRERRHPDGDVLSPLFGAAAMARC